MQNQRKWFLLSTLLVLLAVIFGACAAPAAAPAGGSAPADTGEAAAAPAASDGEKTIIWGVYQEPEILNPAIRTQFVANDVAKLTEEGLALRVAVPCSSSGRPGPLPG